jgi:hypothetical protein
LKGSGITQSRQSEMPTYYIDSKKSFFLIPITIILQHSQAESDPGEKISS